MGSYGIGSGRLLACIAEEHHDDKGLIWPITVAPYHVHLVSLGQAEAADRVYEALLKAGIEVLYDDREESPGVKFNDADLIGIPIRVTVAAKSLAKGGVEVKRRDQPKAEIVAEADLVARVQAEIKRAARCDCGEGRRSSVQVNRTLIHADRRQLRGLVRSLRNQRLTWRLHMQVLTTIEEFRQAKAALPGSWGLVPTMGYLHEGHLVAGQAREGRE